MHRKGLQESVRKSLYEGPQLTTGGTFHKVLDIELSTHSQRRYLLLFNKVLLPFSCVFPSVCRDVPGVTPNLPHFERNHDPSLSVPWDESGFLIVIRFLNHPLSYEFHKQIVLYINLKSLIFIRLGLLIYKTPVPPSGWRTISTVTY